MQKSPWRAEAEAHEAHVRKENRLTVQAMVLTLAVCIAPFLVLPFGMVPALVVLMIGLLLTAWLCFAGASQMGIASRSRVRGMGWLNLVMALATAGVITLMVT